jgi:hypothetical protein
MSKSRSYGSTPFNLTATATSVLRTSLMFTSLDTGQLIIAQRASGSSVVGEQYQRSSFEEFGDFRIEVLGHWHVTHPRNLYVFSFHSFTSFRC